jgi:hypothetical protein
VLLTGDVEIKDLVEELLNIEAIKNEVLCELLDLPKAVM